MLLKLQIPKQMGLQPAWQFKNKETCEHTNTIDILKNVVKEITLKFIKVDHELNYIKEQMKLHGITVNSRFDDSKEEKIVAATMKL